MAAVLEYQNVEVESATAELMSLAIEYMPELAQRIVESSAWSRQPINIDLDTFLATSRAVQKPLRVSQSWLEQQLVIGSDGFGTSVRALGSAIADVRSLHPYTKSSVLAVLEVIRAIDHDSGDWNLWRILSLLPPLADERAYTRIKEKLPADAPVADLVAIRIAFRDWAEPSPETFAIKIVSAMPLRPDLLERVAHILDYVDVHNDEAISLTEALLQRLPQDDWNSRCTLRHALRRLHLRVPSGFQENA